MPVPDLRLPWDDLATAEEERVQALASDDPARQRAALEGLNLARERVGMFGQMLFLLALEYGGTHLGRKLAKAFGQLGVAAWDKATRTEKRADWAAAKLDAMEQRIRELERRLANRTVGVGEPGR